MPFKPALLIQKLKQILLSCKNIIFALINANFKQLKTISLEISRSRIMPLGIFTSSERRTLGQCLDSSVISPANLPGSIVARLQFEINDI